jgi:pyrophosphatase PpaX
MFLRDTCHPEQFYRFSALIIIWYWRAKSSNFESCGETMKSYTAYLFDGDGTLLDTTEMIYQCFSYTCKKSAGVSVTREQVFSHVGLPLRPQLEHLLGVLPDDTAEEVMRLHMDYQLSIYTEYLCLFPGVAESLDRLKKAGKKIAMVTSRRMHSLVLYLKHTHIHEYFDVIITPESTRRHKPEAEPALEAMRQLGVRPHESLFVGDAVFDIACGHAAGIDTAFVTWSRIGPKTITPQPTYLIASMDALV